MRDIKSKDMSFKVTVSIFDNSRIRGAFQDAMKGYADNQKQIQQIFDAYKPAIEAIAKHANIFYEISNSFNNSAIAKEAAALQEQIKSITEKFTLPILPAKEPSLDVPITGGIQQYPTADEIAESVFQKIKERIIDKGGSKKVMDAFGINSPIKLPAGAQWEDLRIKFKNEFDVEVYFQDNFFGKYSHEKLGFARKNTKDKKTDKQWYFLHQLAVIYNNIAYNKQRQMQPTIENLCYSLKIKKNSCMRAVSSISWKLQGVFGIKEKPFYEYDPDKGYQTKFKLEPDSLLKGGGEIFRSSGGAFNENMSSVYQEGSEASLEEEFQNKSYLDR